MKALFGGGKVDGGEGEEPDDGIETARDIIAAVKAGDAELLDRALRDHYAACEGHTDAGAAVEDDLED